MVVDFSKINMKESPVLLLKNASEHIIAPLMSVLSFKAQLYFNEVSVLTFDVPKCFDGQNVEGYDKIQGMRIVEWKDVGSFILSNPVIIDEGISEKKQCKAYSREYEFNNKKISLENATYNFWNPVTPDSTILGIIMSYMPSWSVGTVDSNLIGKYRTFETNNTKLYDFMKNTLQETYSCIFDFDTLNRVVNVLDANKSAGKSPVYLSKHNLAKEIEIEENTDGIVTVLDVNGAEGVTIRSVNPMGSNMIYNLDYYMTLDNFSQDIIDKWSEWKVSYETHQELYYNISLSQSMQIARFNTEYAALTDMKGHLSTLEAQQAVIIQAVSQGLSPKSELDSINIQIVSQQGKISAQENLLTNIQGEIDSIASQLKDINNATSFKSFFSEDELVLLDRYFIVDSITDSNFVAPSTKAYTNADVYSNLDACNMSISDSNIDSVDYGNTKIFHSIRNGNLQINQSGFSVNAEIIKGTIEFDTDGSVIFSCYLNNGTVNGESFDSGTLSLIGSANRDSVGINSAQLQLSAVSCYFTKNVTDYAQRQIEWDLYEYGKGQLNRLSSPSYSFKISLANFFALDEYRDFVNQIAFGQKVYTDTSMGVIAPIVIGATLDYDNAESIEVEFGSTFDINNSTFDLVDLVSQSVSMGKSVDFSKYNYNKFVDSGADSSVREFMTSALDVAKNAILSSSGQAVSWDGAGFRLRKWKDESQKAYDPRQIWMANNSIMFTQDNWANAVIGIGEFADKNLGSCYGIVAPNIVGTLLAGENLVIESVKQDGGISVFRVDGDGAFLHNADFNIVHGNTQITLNAEHGIGIGKYPLYTVDSDGNEIINEANAKFWVDTEGNIHFNGTLEGADGTFSGELKAATGTFKGELSAATGSFKGTISGGDINIGNGNFVVDSAGNLTAKSGTFSGVVKGATYQDSSGTNMMSDGKFKQEYLSLKGLSIKNNTGTTTLAIDSNGNIVLSGNITLGAGSTINWANVTNQNNANNPAYSLANTANSAAGTAKTTADSALSAASSASASANNASTAAASAASLARQIANGTFSGGTFIDQKNIYSPTIYTNSFNIYPEWDGNRYSGQENANFSFYGYFDYRLMEMFRMSVGTADGPFVSFDSPVSASAMWEFGSTTFYGYNTFDTNGTVYFNGTVDFYYATVKNFPAQTAVFG